MIWFGFGFNGFAQIHSSARSKKESQSDEDVEVKVIAPVALRLSTCCSDEEKLLQLVGASWSRIAFLQRTDDGNVCLSGFRSDSPARKADNYFPQSYGCLDAQVSERYLTLAFKDRTECWSLDDMDSAPVWRMKHEPGENRGLPLVPGGYVVSAPPFLHILSPHLCGVSLALGMEHAVLLSGSGAVYTWGSSSHGQLGHGELGREAEPRVVEGLWGMAMEGVAAGGWHSVCVSGEGDLYTWGWNESGQLGLPCQATQRERLQGGIAAGAESDSKEVFISIQAFPALLDLPEEAEVTRVSCGSRHTAALTCKGDLYTWGWGEYGQLGHNTTQTLDQPARVDFFADRGLRVVDVVCGPWNTFVSTEERDPTSHTPP
ncbi:RCC1 domain-containing protein 1-like isoform X2 [Conger conger]|uniref:RCC1 domain-containing protein 1-like isoform X2 n=1 Tax=Conger conger TaxID=82655 RepID=UPI002A59D267|nr:RCC1 domain-containing protein 1-like isoform X2 [Conger conger]